MTSHTPEKTSGRPKPPRRLPPIRLSAVDCRIIASGIDWLDANYRTWSTKGRMPYAHPELRWLPKSFDRGRYNAEFMEQVLAAGKAVNHIYDHGGRLYDFTMFQVAALILALRIVTQNVRHEHFKSLVKDLPRRSKRLIKKLEKHRKRAKRACIVAVGAEQCRARQTEWQAFVRWLRIHFCQCACLVRHKQPRIARLRKQVTTFVEWARAELLDRRDPVPPESELRRMVRQAMRYVRRGRKGYTIRHLENDKVHASAYFCNYVTLTLEKQQRKKKTMRAR